MTLTSMQAVHTSLVDELATFQAPIAGVYVCPHHPTAATVPEFRIVCDCRKPRPGLLLQAAAAHDLDLQASIMIGDGGWDMEAARAAGCQGAYLGDDTAVAADFCAKDLRHAVDWIISTKTERA